MINPDLLEILVCPENRTAVHEISDEIVKKINVSVASGILKNRAGEAITEPIEGGLLREDGKYLYPVRDDIPVMLIDEAIPMDQFD
jgi:uncharacterized protein YbaR (Trm112 family)